jgi:hypothetical protein
MPMAVTMAVIRPRPPRASVARLETRLGFEQQ